LAKLAHTKEVDAIREQLVKAMRLVGIITVPSAVVFLLFGPLVTRTLFFGISDNDANYLGYVLSAFALGLLPMSINLIALRGLNAFENVKLQVVSNAIMNLLGTGAALGLALTLPAKWVTVGLAGALAFSYFVGAFCTVRLLRRYEIRISLAEVTGFYLKLIAIALATALPLRLIQSYLPGGNTLGLLIVLLVGGVGYLGLAHLARVDEVRSALIFLRPTKK
jgi:putative peptidoglycan lipid II flippase